MENIQNDYTGFEVAVIGMSGRFPGAGNIDELWENIKSGTESISFFADEELQAEGVDENLYKSPNYIKAKGILDDIEYFDPEFFDFNSNEANLIDPQIRVFHECVWSALENSGYVPDKYNGLIGLYAGITANMGWNVSKLLQNESGVDQFAIGNLNSNFFSTLISYKLNLKGPSVCIQTACSTSLVAIHNACRALLTGETDIALAGGVTISLPNKQGYLYQEGMVMSPDGHLRAFDKDAKGIVNGNGTGVVVLKRLNDAIKDNDNIQAVIRSSAINNDGNRKVGYTAPSTEGQAEVIKTTHQLAEIESESISYIEAHGTGTSFGDPVEIEALKKAFKTNKKQYCAIGTLKSNIGHLDSAAGVAGFIKTVLSLKNRMLPPSINFKSENPKINFKDSPFYVNTTLKEWKNDKFPLRAGVSSFGIGGTNAHILLEEAPVAQKTSKSRDSQMIFLSAKSKESLENNRNKLVSFLKDNPETNIGDLAYTLQTGRADFKYRAVLVAKSVDEISENLSSDDNGKVIKHFYN
ncbi:MAG: type I polyketide synthase, partial [bacterium]|nr:type I polyketide synthase [bacterium]